MRRQLLPLEFPRLTAAHLRALVNPALKQTDLLGRKIPGFDFIVSWRHRGFGVLVDGSLDQQTFRALPGRSRGTGIAPFKEIRRRLEIEPALARGL